MTVTVTLTDSEYWLTLASVTRAHETDRAAMEAAETSGERAVYAVSVERLESLMITLADQNPIRNGTSKERND